MFPRQTWPWCPFPEGVRSEELTWVRSRTTAPVFLSHSWRLGDELVMLRAWAWGNSLSIIYLGSVYLVAEGLPFKTNEINSRVWLLFSLILSKTAIFAGLQKSGETLNRSVAVVEGFYGKSIVVNRWHDGGYPPSKLYNHKSITVIQITQHSLKEQTWRFWRLHDPESLCYVGRGANVPNTQKNLLLQKLKSWISILPK